MSGEFNWSNDSAVWQVAHGNPTADRTVSAADYLRESIKNGELTELRVMALDLLMALEEMRGDND